MSDPETSISSNTVNWLTEKPISHRGLHSAETGIFENTLSAASASVKCGYPIELDLQPSLDRVPMVFHDEGLIRMTGQKGKIREKTVAELSEYRIEGSGDGIPSLAELLKVVAGKEGLVIELKGIEGKDEGFAEAVLDTLKDYSGKYVLMSFEHHLLEELRELSPATPLGLTAFGEDDKHDIHFQICEKLDLDFVSYYVKHLETRFVKEYRKTGRPVISWTVESLEEANFSAKHADQITFEGFRP